MRLATLVLLVLSVSACSKEEFSYDFTENGCATGKQTFDSKDAMCAGLRSDSRNNGCAVGSRRDKFERDCGGSFSTTN